MQKTLDSFNKTSSKPKATLKTKPISTKRVQSRYRFKQGREKIQIQQPNPDLNPDCLREINAFVINNEARQEELERSKMAAAEMEQRYKEEAWAHWWASGLLSGLVG